MRPGRRLKGACNSCVTDNFWLKFWQHHELLMPFAHFPRFRCSSDVCARRRARASRRAPARTCTDLSTAGVPPARPPAGSATMQYQQYQDYPVQQPQYYEQAPGYGGGGAAPGFAAAPMPGFSPGQQVQYVQSAPQAGGYYESAPQFQQQQQQQYGGAPALIQAQQPMQMPAQAQHPQYASAPQPAYQQPLGNSGRGKLIKAGRLAPSLCSIALAAPASRRTPCGGARCRGPPACLHLRQASSCRTRSHSRLGALWAGR